MELLICIHLNLRGYDMNDLTQEQAERCRKACRWERKTGSHEYMGIDPHPDFLKAYFWFPRLWDKLCELVGPLGWFTLSSGGEANTTVRLNQFEPVDAPGAKHDHPCLALASAIEALEAK